MASFRQSHDPYSRTASMNSGDPRITQMEQNYQRTLQEYHKRNPISGDPRLVQMEQARKLTLQRSTKQFYPEKTLETQTNSNFVNSDSFFKKQLPNLPPKKKTEESPILLKPPPEEIFKQYKRGRRRKRKQKSKVKTIYLDPFHGFGYTIGQGFIQFTDVIGLDEIVTFEVPNVSPDEITELGEIIEDLVFGQTLTIQYITLGGKNIITKIEFDEENKDAKSKGNLLIPLTEEEAEENIEEDSDFIEELINEYTEDGIWDQLGYIDDGTYAVLPPPNYGVCKITHENGQIQLKPTGNKWIGKWPIPEK